MAWRSFGAVDALLERALTAMSLRPRVSADNLANANTPGFKRKDVPFAEVLTQTLAPRPSLPLARTHVRHLGNRPPPSAAPRVVEDGSTRMRNDGNNVDVEHEMAVMARNSMLYEAVVQRVAGRYAQLKSVIREGKR